VRGYSARPIYYITPWSCASVVYDTPIKATCGVLHGHVVLTTGL